MTAAAHRSTPGILLATLAALSLATLSLPPGVATANDGRDRHRRRGAPNLLQLFPEPAAAAAGYRVLTKDGPGGADGDRAFRWARPHAVALVRVAASRTHRRLGPGRYPMAIFDCSAENGDTPIQWTPGKPPRGRHPGGSHDGGLNLDLGYYLTSLTGMHYTPDHAACTDHFDGRGPRDSYQCQGPPDRLDVDRQASLMLELVRLDRDLFGGRLLDNIGIDRRIRDVVLDRLTTWVGRRRHGASSRLVDRLRQVCTADRWEGWARAHHHHIHLRLRDLELAGQALRGGELRLLALDRELDRQKERGPALRTRLLSYGLRRAIEVELVGAPPGDAATSFRVVGTGGWIRPDPASAPRVRAVIDLPAGFIASARSIRAEARLVRRPGDERRLEAALVAPRAEPWLAVGIEPLRLTGFASRQDGHLVLGVTIPHAYRPLITAVSFRIHRANGWVQTIEGDLTRPRVVARGPALDSDPLPQLIVARVVASDRKAFSLPIYLNHEPTKRSDQERRKR